MKILIALNHPAHYYLFKFIERDLKEKGHEIRYVIKGKDILEKILKREGINYTKLISRGKRNSGLISMLTGLGVEMVKQDFFLLRFLRTFQPDIMIGTDISISHVGFLKNIPALVFNEDDIEINKLFSYSTYPFASQLITPGICNVGRFRKKQVKYNGYQKLAYLHPNRFIPDIKVVRKYFTDDKPYFLIRLVSFKAGHDIEQKHGGITSKSVEDLIGILKQKGEVFITSEEKLPAEFENYSLSIDPIDIHHLIFFSSLFIGDSQSMIVEACMLGTPNVRFNSFVGEISVLNELETKYNLTIGISNSNPQLLLKTVENLINTDNLKELYQERRSRMLSDKIDVTAFFVWLIDNYPDSIGIVKENPEYQERFR